MLREKDTCGVGKTHGFFSSIDLTIPIREEENLGDWGNSGWKPITALEQSEPD